MQPSSDVQTLYTKRIDEYIRYAERVRHRQGIRAVIESSPFISSGRRILDAGCGSGLSTRALLAALASRGYTYRGINAFDLTPAMLERYRDEVGHAPRIELRAANVLHLDEDLPPSWCDYDLVLCASMLEYIPKESLSTALSALKRRLASRGHLIIFITRRAFIPARRSWQCHGYTRNELRRSFADAGFPDVDFLLYPPSHAWLNIGNHVVHAENR